ncbi:MAG: hypothetical protein ABI629_02440 [bacterium]
MATIADPRLIARILAHLGLPVEPPPHAAAPSELAARGRQLSTAHRKPLSRGPNGSRQRAGAPFVCPGFLPGARTHRQNLRAAQFWVTIYLRKVSEAG